MRSWDHFALETVRVQRSGDNSLIFLKIFARNGVVVRLGS